MKINNRREKWFLKELKAYFYPTWTVLVLYRKESLFLMDARLKIIDGIYQFSSKNVAHKISQEDTIQKLIWNQNSFHVIFSEWYVDDYVLECKATSPQIFIEGPINKCKTTISFKPKNLIKKSF